MLDLISLIVSFQLQASDGVYTGNALIKIHVVDISDSPPVFNVQTYRVDIAEVCTSWHIIVPVNE